MSKLEKFLKLEEELKIYKKIMSQASDVILDKEVSKYPIFVVHQQQIEIGIPIVDEKNQVKALGNWFINASTLEEFVSKNIVFQDKIDEFTKTYKEATEYLCIFTISELGTQFVFMKR